MTSQVESPAHPACTVSPTPAFFVCEVALLLTIDALLVLSAEGMPIGQGVKYSRGVPKPKIALDKERVRKIPSLIVPSRRKTHRKQLPTSAVRGTTHENIPCEHVNASGLTCLCWVLRNVSSARRSYKRWPSVAARHSRSSPRRQECAQHDLSPMSKLVSLFFPCTSGRWLPNQIQSPEFVLFLPLHPRPSPASKSLKEP